jgi:hypothetical protein
MRANILKQEAERKMQRKTSIGALINHELIFLPVAEHVVR